jgi:hypothetical protein
MDKRLTCNYRKIPSSVLRFKMTFAASALRLVTWPKSWSGTEKLMVLLLFDLCQPPTHVAVFRQAFQFEST